MFGAIDQMILLQPFGQIPVVEDGDFRIFGNDMFIVY